VRRGEKNADRARNKADTEDAEKHLKQGMFHFPEHLHQQSDPRNEHRQRNENVCVEHCQPQPGTFAGMTTMSAGVVIGPSPCWTRDQGRYEDKPMVRSIDA